MATQMSSLKPSRGAVLTVFAVLFVILAISNFSKPFHSIRVRASYSSA